MAEISLEGEPREERKQAFDRHLVARLLAYVKPHRRLLWWALFLLLVGRGCALVMPFIVREAIDDHLVTGVTDGLLGLALAYLALTGVEYAALRAQLYSVDRVGQRSLYDLRVDLFRNLQRLSSRFYDRTPTGRLVGRLTTDIEALQELFSSGVVTVIAELFMLVVVFVLLFVESAELTLVTLSVVPLLIGLTLWMRVRVRAAYEIMRAKLSHLNAFLHEHISGMPLIQMFRREGTVRDDYREINGDLKASQLTSVHWESWLSSLVELLTSFTTALIVWHGGGMVVEGLGGPPRGDQLTIGTLFAFIVLMQKFFTPLNELSLKYTVMQNAMTAGGRIFHLLDEEDRLPEPSAPRAPAEARGGVEFRDVHFAYRAGEPVLRGVSFRVEPGERVAIVGATGSGKTTLLKLLSRLYDVQEGAVLLDGVDVREYASTDLRRRLGVVPQDGLLFEGSVLDNLRLGHPEVSEEQAVRAAGRLHLDEVVGRFPRGYHEPVAERGRNLSAGERQLLAFARTLAVAPCVLALDEATSHVDSRTEHLLQEAVHELMQRRTALIVAHRLSTIQDVDRILVMHKGELVEEGTHAELLAERGIYWRLFRLQHPEALEPRDLQSSDGA